MAGFQAAVAGLPVAEQARIELELAQVHELAHAEALLQLSAAVQGRDLPPDSIPGDAARALWYFLNVPELFQDVFLHQQIVEVDAWRIAQAPPGVVLHDLTQARQQLASSLQKSFQAREGSGRFCAVEAYRLSDCWTFSAHLSEQLQLLDVFTERGEHTTQATRPAVPLLFVYYPDQGRLLLKTRQRAADKLLDLFQRFGRTVLGVELDERCRRPAFRLDLLKQRFDPPLDGNDLVAARVKTLHLLYPERCGRRRLKLETLTGDRPFAILDLLHAHGGAPDLLAQLDVGYAELEVTLRLTGRLKHVVIRLWPDRCNLNQTALGERLRVCLRRWCLTYGP